MPHMILRCAISKNVRIEDSFTITGMGVATYHTHQQGKELQGPDGTQSRMESKIFDSIRSHIPTGMDSTLER